MHSSILLVNFPAVPFSIRFLSVHHNIIGTIIKPVAIKTKPIINNVNDGFSLFVNRAVICGAARMLPNGVIAPANNLSKKSKFSRSAPTGSFPSLVFDVICLGDELSVKIALQAVKSQLSYIGKNLYLTIFTRGVRHFYNLGCPHLFENACILQLEQGLCGVGSGMLR